MSGLLVSVRSTGEADAALAGGADLIDVKEPARGPLGRADDTTITGVVERVAGCRPVTAALGELVAGSSGVPQGVSFLKWGLAGLGGDPTWRTRLEQAGQEIADCGLRIADQRAPSSPIRNPQSAIRNRMCRPVAVAYADWQLAQSPRPGAVAEFARGHHWPVLLIDTFGKDGHSLLDWIDMVELVELCRSCQSAGVAVALAGSLDEKLIEELLPVAPDWFAVRSAACRGGRGGAVCSQKVRRLAEIVHSTQVVVGGTP
jgi:uncharacterized protein (UPF0264 family)